MSIILDGPPDDPTPVQGDRTMRLKGIKAWLAHRERKEAAQATRDIVSSLYPKRRSDPPPEQPSP